MLRLLGRVVAEAPGRPDGAGADHPMRKVTSQVAFEPDGWTPERAAKVAALFDDLAPTWNQRGTADRTEALDDALARGGPFLHQAPCLEAGCGTGLITPLLAEHFPVVIALDLAFEMLCRAPSDLPAPRVHGDSSRLPLPSASMGTVVLVNAFLFPSEVERVLLPGGALVWVNTLGDRTPIHLPAEAVDRALGGGWEGVGAEAGWGTWAVFRKPAAR
ncbi:MAG TPA: class I SAM-dependent methyltransferase [Acidimicrobiales bacterium]|nr:class I SAM-dependent methyltransferase [Acidimicrobiales bacterium]